MQKFFSKFKCLLFPPLLFFAACSPQPQYDRRQSLVVAIPSAPFSLDPRVAKDAEGQKIGALLYDGLVTLDENQAVVPLLAERWESVGPWRYRFHLRPGVFFSNGAAVTSKDVACTFAAILDGKNLSPLRGDFLKMELRVVDDAAFEIALKEPFAPFFVLLKKGIVACDGVSGSGPYTLVSHEPQRRVVLQAHEKYFGGAPKIKNLIFEVVKEDTTRVLKLMKHEVDLVQNAIPPLLIPKILENKKIKMATALGTTFAYLGMNLRDPLLQKKEVRQAIALAIDRDAVIRYLWKNFSAKADSLLSPVHWAYAPGLISYERNLERAKELLRSAGILHAPLTLKTSTVKDRVEIAKFLAHQLGEVGLQVKVQPNDWGILFRDIKRGNFQLYTSTWVGVTEPDLFYNILNSSQIPPAGDNRNFFVNAAADALTLQGRRTVDLEERKKIYHAIQKLVQEELPFIGLWYENNVALYWDDLKGVTLTPTPDYRNFVKVSR